MCTYTHKTSCTHVHLHAHMKVNTPTSVLKLFCFDSRERPLPARAWGQTCR